MKKLAALLMATMSLMAVTVTIGASPAAAVTSEPYRITALNNSFSAKCSHVWVVVSNSYKSTDIYWANERRYKMWADTKLFLGSASNPDSCARTPYKADRITYGGFLTARTDYAQATNTVKDVHTPINFGATKTNASSFPHLQDKVRARSRTGKVICAYSTHAVKIQGKTYNFWALSGQRDGCRHTHY